uniref:Putative secreted protein n=1 Tax=Amblyomma triste TaxID=251400 RepID=A0A023G342_AMBTT
MLEFFFFFLVGSYAKAVDVIILAVLLVKLALQEAKWGTYWQQPHTDLNAFVVWPLQHSSCSHFLFS